MSGTSTEGRPAALFLVLAWHRVGQVTRALSPRSFTTLPTHHPYPLEIAAFSRNPVYLLLLSVVNVGCPRAYAGKWEDRKHPPRKLITSLLLGTWVLYPFCLILSTIQCLLAVTSKFCSELIVIRWSDRMECVYSIWSETGTSCKIYFNSLQLPDKNYERGFQYLFLQQKLTLLDLCVMRMLEGVNDTWCEMQEQCPQTMLQTWFADKIVRATARHWMSQLVLLLLKSRELTLSCRRCSTAVLKESPQVWMLCLPQVHMLKS